MDCLLAKDPEKIHEVSRHDSYICIRKCSREQSWALWLADAG